MGVDHRVTLTKRHAYRTRGNKIKTIKTPGMPSFSSSSMYICIVYMYVMRIMLVNPVDNNGFFLSVSPPSSIRWSLCRSVHRQGPQGSDVR
jgi:hypothetical protein